MKKVAWIVITDLHLSGHRKDNRISYENEVHYSFKFLLSVIQKYKQSGHYVILVFLGDIFDKSYKTPSKYGIDQSLISHVVHQADESFVVLGNHEVSFHSNNPFWTLMTEIESKRVKESKILRTQPLGYENLFRMVDTVNMGDCTFHFNHHNCVDSSPSLGKVNIAFYHKSIYNKLIVSEAERVGAPTQYIKYTSSGDINQLLFYDYAFMGHMHSFYGKWSLKNTTVYYLSNLVRPSKAEIIDTFLERNIPVIILEDDKFSRIESNTFNLMPYSECINEDIDLTEKETYAKKRIISEARSYISDNDEPLNNIRSFYISNERMISLLDDLLGGVRNSQEISLVLKELGEELKA